MEMHAQPRPACSNLALLEHAYARWVETRGGNVDEILAIMDDDIVMDSVLPPEMPTELSGSHHRKDGVAAYFRGLLEDWEMVDWGVDRFIADAAGDDIVMIGHCHWRHRASGQDVRSPKIDVWHFDHGRATRFYEMFDTLAFARTAGML